MRKILIISYFYPPSNFVGGERTEAWAKHLSSFGYYPIVITRQWNPHQKDIVDPLLNNELAIEKNESFEVHRLPYKRPLRDRMASTSWLKPFQKLLTLKEMIHSNYSVKGLPYANFQVYAEDLIQQDDSIMGVIVSGRPFQAFQIGHYLKSKYNVLWIPDYRDEWTTHKHLENAGTISKYINKLERRSELKWTSNADFFISVSQNWVDNIEKLIRKNGEVVLNGYKEFHENRTSPSDTLTITYAGTLYPSQNIELFIAACKEVIDDGFKIKIKFIGADVLESEVTRLNQLIGEHDSQFELISRVPRKELDDHLDSSDALFLTSFNDIIGWYPVKLFEYYASGLPILLCPSDNNVMDEFVRKSNCGYIADTIEECKTVLIDLIEKKKTTGIPLNRNTEFGSFFSRENQVKELASIIKKYEQ